MSNYVCSQSMSYISDTSKLLHFETRVLQMQQESTTEAKLCTFDPCKY